MNVCLVFRTKFGEFLTCKLRLTMTLSFRETGTVLCNHDEMFTNVFVMKQNSRALAYTNSRFINTWTQGRKPGKGLTLLSRTPSPANWLKKPALHIQTVRKYYKIMSEQKVQRSEDVLGLKWDRCLSDSVIKIGKLMINLFHENG